MRKFDYSNIPNELLDHEIINLLGSIHEYKGKQDLYIEAKLDILTAMLEIAKIQSTAASNRIEGIYTSEERMDAIMNEKVEPHNRSEREIAGYREVLKLVHESYDFCFHDQMLFCNYIEIYINTAPVAGGVLIKTLIMLSNKSIQREIRRYGLNQYLHLRRQMR